MTVIGDKYVQKHKRETDEVKDKGSPSEIRRIYNGRLISTDHLTDLIWAAKLDYRFGQFFGYEW